VFGWGRNKRSLCQKGSGYSGIHTIFAGTADICGSQLAKGPASLYSGPKEALFEQPDRIKKAGPAWHLPSKRTSLQIKNTSDPESSYELRENVLFKTKSA